MAGHEALSNTQLLTSIADGSIGGVEVDKGGNYSSEYYIWVDHSLPAYIARLSPEDHKVVEIMGGVGLVVGKTFEGQLDDADDGTMYPPDVLRPEGADLFLAAAASNPTVGDPYSIIPNLDQPATPYSHVYQKELTQLRGLLTQLTDQTGPSAVAQRQYIEALITAYSYDPERTSDLQAMHEADEQWVQIPSDVDLLFFAEPTEVYPDPVRATLGQDQRVADWAKQVTTENKQGPWRNFFEFRLLMKDESMVTEDEIHAVRRTSRTLFAGPDDKEVPVSLEFRRLLMASGNGAFPAKTAKNYPNFIDIRDEVGYKNVLYTNMIEEGAITQLLPVLERAFGQDFVGQLDESQLVRGSALRVVAHEENHPFRRHEGNTAFEELKATVNGMVALMRSGQFTEDDIKYALTTAIGSGLYTRSIVKQAREEGDERTYRGKEAYYLADTIMMNYLASKGGFVGDISIKDMNFEKLADGMIQLADQLEAVRQGTVTITEIHERYGSEDVWKKFQI